MQRFRRGIRKPEGGLKILLNVDTISRVQSTQTAYDMMRQVMSSNRSGDWQSSFARKILITLI